MKLKLSKEAWMVCTNVNKLPCKITKDHIIKVTKFMESKDQDKITY